MLQKIYINVANQQLLFAIRQLICFIEMLKIEFQILSA